MNALTQFASALMGMVKRSKLSKPNQQQAAQNKAVNFNAQSPRVPTDNNRPKFPEGTLAALHERLSPKKSA